MRPIDIISIIILSLSISSWGGNARSPPPNSTYPWKGFRLSLEWPAAFCDLNAETCIKNSLLNTFTIHGLWPYKAKGNLLMDCPGTELFSVNFVADFLAEMHLAWPSFDNRKSAEEFWKHEWDRHGKCSKDLLKQKDYFRTALAFRKAFDILGLLNKEGIYPNDALYRPKLIKEAIKKNLNSMPALICEPKNKKWVLTEIYLCVNQFATKFVDCPTSPKGADCDNYPKIKFVSLASQLQIAPRSNAISSASTCPVLKKSYLQFLKSMCFLQVFHTPKNPIEEGKFYSIFKSL